MVPFLQSLFRAEQHFNAKSDKILALDLLASSFVDCKKHVTLAIQSPKHNRHIDQL